MSFSIDIRMGSNHIFTATILSKKNDKKKLNQLQKTFTSLSIELITGGEFVENEKNIYTYTLSVSFIF